MAQNKIYYIRTNAYDAMILDDGETRFVYTENEFFPKAGAERTADEALKAVEDWSSWEVFEDTADELIADADVLATVEI